MAVNPAVWHDEFAICLFFCHMRLLGTIFVSIFKVEMPDIMIEII